MLYDLNIPWSATQPTEELQRTVSFLSQEGYNAVALNHTITGALPSQIVNPIPLTQQFTVPKNTTLLRRCTLHIADPTLNHRLPELVRAYDILALRPTTEKAYLSACLTLDHHSIISLDLTQRSGFSFRPKQAMTAVNRGIFFEICYAQGTMGDSVARTNFISGALGILRATRGRGIIISSEATNLLGIRHPADVVNLLCVWGMSRDRAEEGLGVNPRAVVVNEGLKRSGFRGMIDVIEGGKQELKDDRKEPGQKTKVGKKIAGNSGKPNKNKRKADEKGATGDGTPQISKRKAKKMRLEALKASKEASREGSSISQTSIPTANTSEDSGSPSTPKENANG